jgi:predicted component of type VI protein secretion system
MEGTYKKEKKGNRPQIKKMYWLLGRKSQLSVHNKLLLYKQVLTPILTYGIQLWRCAATSNINKIQIFQNKVLRGIVDAPWYYRNDHLHKDLRIPTIRQEIQRFAERHERRLHNHVNTEVLQLLDNTNLNRRFKRIKPFELCSA